MRIPIITVNYNGGEKIIKTLESRFANTEDFVQIVVDNGSTDDSVEHIKKRFPEVKVTEAGENLGFGRGNNLGLEKVLAGEYGDSEYVVLANPDMLHVKGWLPKLVDTISKDKKIAAVNPLILYTDKFNVLKVQTTNPEIYLFHTDYRFLANLIGKTESKTKEITLEGKQYVQVNTSEFLLLIEENYQQLDLVVYDEALQGYQINIGGKIFKTNKYERLLKKILYKLKLAGINSKMTNISIPVKELQLEKKAVEVVNALGTGIRKGQIIPENHYYGQFVEDIPKKEHQVDLWYGACVILRTSVLKEVGLFDPQYFMYYEESDLAMQQSKAGYKFMVNPNSIVYHMEKYAFSDKTIGYLQESQQKFIQKWAKAI